MLTRRQARLLGLTIGEEASTANGAADASRSVISASPLAVPSTPSFSSSTAAFNSISGLRASSTSSPLQSSGIVLRLSSSTNNNVNSGHSINGNMQLCSTVVSSPSCSYVKNSSGSNSASTLYGGRGRLGVRQAEMMLASAQNTIYYWSAAGTTAGPVIQLPSSHGFCKSEYSSAAPDIGQRGYDSKSSALSSSDSSRRGEKSGSAGSTSTSSAAQRPMRLSTTQLRAHWRGVTRNCTTLNVHPRNRSTVTASTASPSSLPMNSDNTSDNDVMNTTTWKAETSATHHRLKLSLTAGGPGAYIKDALSRNDTHPRHYEDSSNNVRTMLNNGETNTMHTFIHVHGTHRDTAALPEAFSRRSTTCFIPPFHSDAPTLLHVFNHQNGSPTQSSHSLPLTRHVRKPLTALALRQLTQAQTAAQQRRLCYEVYYQVYVKAHEARMRMLFGLDRSESTSESAMCEDDGAGSLKGSPHLQQQQQQHRVVGAPEVEDAVAAGEAAYLASLDPSKSEEQAKVLRVIASIDAALKRQFASAYQHHVEGVNPVGKIGSETLSQDTGPSASKWDDNMTSDSAAAASLPPRRSSSSVSFAARRPAIIEAVIASTTERVEAFVDQLLPYQQEGVRWLLRLNALEHMNGILADDMGLGKTAQTVVYLSCYKDMVEEAVQQPLMALRDQHTQLCQRALGLAAGTDVTEPKLPPWLAWCVAAAKEEDEVEAKGPGEDLRPLHEAGEASMDGHRRASLPSTSSSLTPVESIIDGGVLFHMPHTPGNAVLAAARRCGRTIQLVKEVKRWLWQLDDENNLKEGSSLNLGSEPSSLLSPASPTPSSALSVSEIQVNGDAKAVAAPAATATAVHVVSSLPLKRRRGRPPKHLSAMMAASAAASASGSTQRTLSSRPSHTSSPAPLPALTPSQSLLSMIEHQSRLLTCTPALDQRLVGELQSFLPVLIIAPLSTLPHWAGEFHRFSRRRAATTASTSASDEGSGSRHVLLMHPSEDAQNGQDRFQVYVLNGPRTERETRMQDFLKHAQMLVQQQRQQRLVFRKVTTPILVIPHDMLTRPLSGSLRQISRVQWHVVVIDEAQRIKSARSALFKKVRHLHSVSRLVLTGTPLQNNTMELFSLLQFLAPHSFTAASSDLFEQLDSALIAASRFSVLEDRELHILLCRRVHRLLMPFILRREKVILRTALPPIRDYAVLCPLLPFQKMQLEEVKRKHQEGTLSGSAHIQYRKILLHPYTTQAFFYVDEEVVQTSGKLLVLDFMMRFLQRTRHKFLIFCGWTLVLDVVETLCSMRNIPYVRLDGKTSVEKREANIQGFNRPIPEGAAEGKTPNERDGGYSMRSAAARHIFAGSTAEFKDANRTATTEEEEEEDVEKKSTPAPCCFLISKVAGGVGLNLQAADTVFLLDVDYNPQRDAQALSRVYRVGQTREVRVFRLVIDHPIERNIVAIHEAKENLGRAVIQAGRYDLHSSVREREEALQRIFRCDTLSQLSRQWSDALRPSLASPPASAKGERTSPSTSPRAIAAEGENDDKEGSSSGEDAKEEERVIYEEDDDEGNAGFADATLAASDGFPTKLPASFNMDVVDPENEAASFPGSPGQMPADQHHVLLLRSNGPMPLAVKRFKTEPAEGGDAVKCSENLRASQAESARRAPPPPRRKRRHISFKLEGDTEGSKDSSSPSDGVDADDAKGEDDGGGSHCSNNGTLFRAVPSSSSLMLAQQNGENRGVDDGITSEKGQGPRAVTPAALLLAMRERLEEVLLRNDGERGVLQDMFHSLEASLTAVK